MKHVVTFALALVAAAAAVHALTHRAAPPLAPDVLNRARARLAVLARAPHPLGSAEHRAVQAQLAAWAAEDGAVVEQHRGTGTRQDGELTVLFDAPVVLARVEGTTPGASALVVDAHFDSAAESPGASDNGVAVVAALEALRALVRTPGAHPVVFAFDGSEEERLTGASAALTHPWVATAEAHVNLDAVGRAGRPVVFRASPAARPLLRTYAGTVSAAHASVLGRDLVESGAVPSETDHRIYDQLGHLPGLDVALYEDGAAYHTALDGPAGVSDEVLTRVVGALAAFVPAAASLPHLTDDAASPWVFFDVLGLGLLVPSPLALLAVGLLAAGLSVLSLRGESSRARALLAVGLALVLSVLAAAVAAALVVFVLRGPHFWFAHPPLALAYGLAAAVGTAWSAAFLGRVASVRAALAAGGAWLGLAGAALALGGLGAAYVLAGVAGALCLGALLAGRWPRAGSVAAAALSLVVVLDALLPLLQALAPAAGRLGLPFAFDLALAPMVALLLVGPSLCWLGLGGTPRGALATSLVTVALLGALARVSAFDDAHPRRLELIRRDDAQGHHTTLEALDAVPFAAPPIAEVPSPPALEVVRTPDGAALPLPEAGAVDLLVEAQPGCDARWALDGLGGPLGRLRLENVPGRGRALGLSGGEGCRVRVTRIEELPGLAGACQGVESAAACEVVTRSVTELPLR